MDAEEFAEFYRVQGYKILRSESCFWYEVSRFFYQAIPFHCSISPAGDELNKVFFGGPAVGVRYMAEAGSGGRESYLWVQDDRQYDLPSLQQKARNQTRRGLEKCRIEKIGFDHLQRQGFQLVQDALCRQGRSLHTISEQYWRLLCGASARQRDVEAWGALIDDKLAAVLIAVRVNRCFYILHQYSGSGFLQHYPNNALIFAVTRRALTDGDIDYVSYGIESLDAEHTQGLDRFKSSMGYKKSPVSQHIRFNPVARPFFGKITLRAVRRIHAIIPGSDFLRKLNGILNCHLASKETGMS